MLDIDHFKRFNDSLGHPEGDRCLIQVAHLVQQLAKRPADQVARIGGRVCGVAARDRPGRGSPCGRAHCGRRGSHGPDASGFAGVVSDHRVGRAGTMPRVPALDPPPVDGNLPHSPIALIRTADQALYRAKEAGRNRFAAASVGDAPQA